MVPGIPRGRDRGGYSICGKAHEAAQKSSKIVPLGAPFPARDPKAKTQVVSTIESSGDLNREARFRAALRLLYQRHLSTEALVT